MKAFRGGARILGAAGLALSSWAGVAATAPSPFEADTARHALIVVDALVQRKSLLATQAASRLRARFGRDVSVGYRTLPDLSRVPPERPIWNTHTSPIELADRMSTDSRSTSSTGDPFDSLTPAPPCSRGGSPGAGGAG